MISKIHHIMQKSATVAVINVQKKLLILRRGTSAPWMPGNYCLPGGKVEPNEELINCAVRELGEETGIHIIDTNYLAPYTISYPKYSKTIFYISLNNPNISLNWEHDNYAWVSSTESFQYPLVPGLSVTIKTLSGHGLMI